ncbi:MAG TPA: glutathione S-transferase [Beijerinckia sp.]|jgi:glutathione S-transferase|nr:glutathione S-transferase [Beijerinckia sp.]
MMVLRSSPPSPFGRKVRIAAALVGLSDQIEVVNADTSDPNDVLRNQNPLGKIPVLILDDGTAYYDSRVIIEYLDHLGGGNVLIPAAPEARFRALTSAAEADGILDACILQVYEARFRDPSRHEPKWLAYQADKVARALASLALAPPSGPRDAGHIGLACALGYLDLRFAGKWRSDHPKLVAWLDAFAAEVPAFEATRYIG